jgi:hypothetical protein
VWHCHIRSLEGRICAIGCGLFVQAFGSALPPRVKLLVASLPWVERIEWVRALSSDRCNADAA